MRSLTPELHLEQLYEDWIRFNVNGRLLSCSGILRERWAATGLLASARQASDFFKLTADDSEGFFNGWVLALRGSASVLNLRMRGFDLADRTVVFMPEFSEGGTVVESVVVGSLRVCQKGAPATDGIDATVSKLAEMRDMFHDIAKANRELETALQAAKAEIEYGKTESQAKTDFLANMSHEIRTPMNAVIGFCDLLSNTRLTREQSEYVDAITHSGKLLIDLIGQVLDYSKVDSGHLELECEDLDLSSIFLEVQAIMGAKTRNHAIDFKVDCQRVSAELLVGDETRVKQILINLLGNAYKFTRAGEISLTASTTTSEYAGHLCLRVRIEDTGIGIAPERIRSLFCPFAQAHGRGERGQEGTGLGLAICKRLCEAMRGDIWIERTELDKGSVFTLEIHLPRKNPGVRPLNSRANVEEKDLMKSSEKTATGALKENAPLRLLVVDDNPNNLLITSKLSQHLGYKAETVTNGVDALKKMKSGEFHIVLMDVRMAPINGMETTRMIREGEAGDESSGAYIIAVTAHALQGDKERCIQSGMNDYLSKPLTLERLEESLNRARAELSLD
ncbi:ATP-binding protein [Pelagicoccus sp. SDUM812005]|uniref:ATP-binding protein n=1 Tax=Pelagicoccus sp. SDUM812005 TaxID=3041257 RepID=UPI00280FF7AA|nr:ATP-binding protein [Pelagicoccus sp. SDUM812005]MDQ8182414.1 ATP-binding protein [Pelagicoccus sp. SDUM812005]